MYRWEITEKIHANLRRIAELKNNLDTRGVLPRRWVGRLRRELESASVAASTSMEGVPVTVDEVRRILAGDHPPSVSEEDTKLVEGYRDAMSFVLRRADDTSFSWQTELILGIHDRVLAGSHAAGAGRFRTGQVHVADAGAGHLMYTPPPPDTISELMTELSAFAGENQTGTEPPVLAAIIHVRLAGIHPFADGNGRAARILASLVMYRGGYTVPEFTSLEEYWGAHRDDYYRAFSCLGDTWDPGADVTPFISAHVDAQRLQVDTLSLRQVTEREIWTILEDIATEDLSGPPRYAEALYDAFFGREVSNRYYRGLTDVAIATATKDLGRLEASGLLAARGAGRTRTYVGTHELFEKIASIGGIDQVPVDPAVPIALLRQTIIGELARRVSAFQKPGHA